MKERYFAIVIPRDGSKPRVLARNYSWSSPRAGTVKPGDVVVPFTVKYPSKPKELPELPVIVVPDIEVEAETQQNG